MNIDSLLVLLFSDTDEDTYRIAAHLEALEFDVSLVCTEWFLCLFAKSLPSEVNKLSLYPLCV